MDEVKMQSNYTTIQMVSVWSVCGFLSVFGIASSSTMIVVLMRMKRTFLTVILAGLCVSDLISAVNSPLFIYRQFYKADLALPKEFCFLPLSVDLATSAITVHHVLLLTAIRLRLITRTGNHGEVAPNNCRRVTVASYVFSISVYSFLCFIITNAEEIDGGISCSFNTKLKNEWKIILVLSLSLITVIPTILTIVFCVVLIACFLYRKLLGNASLSVSSAARHRERQALLQLAVIVASFLIGYASDYTGKMIMLTDKFQMTQGVKVGIVLGGHVALRLTECINPFTYYIASDNIKRETESLFKELHGRIVKRFHPSRVDQSKSDVSTAVCRTVTAEPQLVKAHQARSEPEINS